MTYQFPCFVLIGIILVWFFDIIPWSSSYLTTLMLLWFLIKDLLWRIWLNIWFNVIVHDILCSYFDCWFWCLSYLVNMSHVVCIDLGKCLPTTSIVKPGIDKNHTFLIAFIHNLTTGAPIVVCNHVNSLSVVCC